MSILGGLGNSRSSSSSQSAQSTNANYGQAATNITLSNVGNTGKKGNSEITVNALDGGAIADSYSFAGQALDRASAGFDSGLSQISSAFNSALTEVAKAAAPADEQTREQFTTLVKWGMVAAVLALVLPTILRIKA